MRITRRTLFGAIFGTSAASAIPAVAPPATGAPETYVARVRGIDLCGKVWQSEAVLVGTVRNQRLEVMA